jgi:hypothetical protein
MKNNYKVLLYAQDEEGDAAWMDFYLSVAMIDGFYVPNLEEDELPSINIFVAGQFITILQQDHIMDYLNERFENCEK